MIEIQAVSKSFGPVRALQDVSLTISPGERVAFVGSNGSGKTTLLRAVLGLLRVSGQIRIEGVDVAASPERALRHVAYVPQISPPLEAPVREVVRAHAALRGIAASAVAQHAQALGLALSGCERTRFRDLSGGMKQKLLAAMALATPAHVLVCDEPTSNLDAAARHAFFSAIERRAPGSILLLCSHREEEVAHYVERVIELGDGRVVRDEHAALTTPSRMLKVVR